MVTVEPIEVVRFGRTAIVAVTGELLDQEVDAVVIAANCRGMMGALGTSGLGSFRSFGGSEIEREAMAMAPFELGQAVVTGTAGLEASSIRAMIHAVVQPMLGAPTRVDTVKRVVPAILTAADRHRLRTLALPLLGVESSTTPRAAAPFVGALVDELVGCLRRAVVRLDRVVIVCRFADHRDLVAAALVHARARAWTRPG